MTRGFPVLPPAASVSVRCARRGSILMGDDDLIVVGLLETGSGCPAKHLIWYRRGFHTPHHLMPNLACHFLSSADLGKNQ